MEQNQGNKHPVFHASKLIWEFFIWSRTLFPQEYLPHRDSAEPFDLVTHELHHLRTHVVSLFEHLLEGFYTHPQKAILNNLSDVDAVEDLVRKEVADSRSLGMYLSWLDSTRQFLMRLQTEFSEENTERP